MRGDVLSIGALATYTDIIRSPLVRRRLPMLVAAAREVGGVQIQNRGTIGGNVANASPAGDTLPVLAAADAIGRPAERRRRRAACRSSPSTRAIAARSRRADELIVAFEVPTVRGRQWFRKVGTRAAQAISKVVMAAVAPVAGDPPRIALGSVAPTVVRLPSTEAALAAGASIDEAQRIADRGDRADRRHPLDGRVSHARRGQPARPFLERPASPLEFTNLPSYQFTNSPIHQFRLTIPAT